MFFDSPEKKLLRKKNNMIRCKNYTFAVNRYF